MSKSKGNANKAAANTGVKAAMKAAEAGDIATARREAARLLADPATDSADKTAAQELLDRTGFPKMGFAMAGMAAALILAMLVLALLRA